MSKQINCEITWAQNKDAQKYFDHLLFHLDESTAQTLIFHPLLEYKSWDKKDFIKKLLESWEADFDIPSWKRTLLLWDKNQIVGHLNFQRSIPLASCPHRLRLGMGIVATHTGRGWGEKLLGTGILWAKEQGLWDYIDLSVFENNRRAQRLYEKMGFVKQSTHFDLFRLQGQVINDINMVLKLRN